MGTDRVFIGCRARKPVRENRQGAYTSPADRGREASLIGATRAVAFLTPRGDLESVLAIWLDTVVLALRIDETGFLLMKMTSKPTRNPPPSGLSSAAQAWWKRLHAEFDLADSGAAFLLEAALRAFDRMNEAGILVDRHGVAVLDKFQQLKANPAVAAERDSRAAMLGAFKQLGLDTLPPQRPGRPSGK